jgi:hypothetical protein
MKTVNSLSGGKTSSYLSIHYPADFELFALVCNDDPKCGHPDKKIMQLANDKLQKYSSHWGEFIGTAEHYSIIKTILDLEQLIGREIIWLRDISFDKLCEKRSAIPNMMKRFCTTEMKLKPIFEFCQYRIGEFIDMRVGFRYDEKERAERFSTTYKHATHCEIRDNSKIHRWKETEWRKGSFPLIDNKILHHQVYEWSKQSGIYFHADSNCQNCFWKPYQQLRKNFDESPNVMQWAKKLEQRIGRTFKDDGLEFIENIGLQAEFNFGTGSGCQAGFCTD